MPYRSRSAWPRVLIGAAMVALLVPAAVLPAGAREPVGRTGAGSAAAPQRDARPLPAFIYYEAPFLATRGTFSQLGIWNLYRGTRVTLSARGPNAPSIAATRIAPASGFVDLRRFIRNVPLPAGTVLAVGAEYRPPGAPAERYFLEGDYTVVSHSYVSFGSHCSITTPGVQTTACFLPCPRPAGVSLDYCKGASQVLHFRAVLAAHRVGRRLRDRGVRITKLVIQNRTAGATISVRCDPAGPARPGECPRHQVFPHLGHTRVTVRGLGRSILAPESRVHINIYRGNAIGQQISIEVQHWWARRALLIKRNCRFSDATVGACPR